MLRADDVGGIAEVVVISSIAIIRQRLAAKITSAWLVISETTSNFNNSYNNGKISGTAMLAA